MKYTAIADTGNVLVRLLRTYMAPEVVANPDHIGLYSPVDKGDRVVGVYLFDVRECKEVQSHSMIMVDPVRQQFPSTFINLFYMITAYSDGDIKYRAEEEHRILGKVIQVCRDHAVLEQMIGGEGLPEGETVPAIELLNLDLEEKMRIWNFPSMTYKTSLFYKVGPVEIASERMRKAERVMEAEFTMKQTE